MRVANAKGLLFEAAASDDAPSFDAVFDTHGAYVARTLRCLGVRDHELDDACQEVFVVVHRRLSELTSASALRAWLYGICLRKAMAQRRAVARRREASFERDMRSIEPDQEESVERRERLARALVILDALSDEKRAVFVLYEVEQLTMSEVAEVVGCPMQTAYARLYAARREVEASLRRLRAGGRIE